MITPEDLGRAAKKDVHQLRDDISDYVVCGEQKFPMDKDQVSTNDPTAVTCRKCRALLESEGGKG